MEREARRRGGGATGLLDMLKRIAREALEAARGIQQAALEQSVEALELELIELEHAFATLLMGSLAGLPLAPLGLAAELAPLMEEELRVMFSRTWRGGDVVGDLFTSLSGEW